MHRAKQPKFPVGIQTRTFQLVEDNLKLLEYTGPLGLSCDDTKLLASFRPYWDQDREGYYVMGHVGDPYRLADPESFKAVINSGDLVKGTKVTLSPL